MDISDAPRENTPGQQYVVRADEVDQAGTAMTVDSTKDSVPLSAIPLPRDDSSSSVENRAPGKKPFVSRPNLRRENSAPPPPPPLQPPPPAPDQTPSPENPTDSLSLPQLRSLVSQFPKTEQKAYAFEYADSESFPIELNEWFHYAEKDRIMLLSAKENFDQRWREFCKNDPTLEDEASWISVDERLHKDFCRGVFEDFTDSDIFVRVEAVETILYILAGVWGYTAGLPSSSGASEGEPRDENDPFEESLLQIDWIKKGSLLISDCSGINALYSYFQNFVKTQKYVASSLLWLQAEDDPALDPIRPSLPPAMRRMRPRSNMHKNVR